MRLRRCEFLFTAAAALLLAAIDPAAGETQRTLYAVSQAAEDRGAISVYDIDGGHRLIKTIRTVPNVHNVRGVAASAASARLYVAYYDAGNTGRIYCLDLNHDSVVWDRAVARRVDRLAVNPDGQLLY